MTASSPPEPHRLARIGLRVADCMERPAVWLGRYSSWLMLLLAGLIVFDAANAVAGRADCL